MAQFIDIPKEIGGVFDAITGEMNAYICEQFPKGQRWKRKHESLHLDFNWIFERTLGKPELKFERGKFSVWRSAHSNSHETLTIYLPYQFEIVGKNEILIINL